jgi:DNA gyrase subunit B
MSDQLPPSTSHGSNYDSSKITVLRGLEAVRKRPGMYIGDVHDGTGLHHMVFEVGRQRHRRGARRLLPTQVNGHHPPGWLGLDVGQRPRHPGRHPQGRRRLRGRGGHDRAARRRQVRRQQLQVSGGLHGVGVSVVNALSEHLWLDIWRDGQHHQQEYALGEPVSAEATGAHRPGAARRCASSRPPRSSPTSSSTTTSWPSACANCRSSIRA